MTNIRQSQTWDDFHRSVQNSTTPQNGSSNVDGTVVIVIFIAVLFCFLWSPGICQYCRNRNREQRDALRMAHGNATGSSTIPIRGRPLHEMSREERLDFISNVLVTKKVVVSNPSMPQKDAEPSVLARKKSDLVISSSLASSKHIVDIEGGKDCSDMVEPCNICLSDYQEGEEICWSHNRSCNHVFHRECILKWLLRHDECPCCRHNFLTLDDNNGISIVMPPPAANVPQRAEQRSTTEVLAAPRHYWLGRSLVEYLTQPATSSSPRIQLNLADEHVMPEMNGARFQPQPPRTPLELPDSVPESAMRQNETVPELVEAQEVAPSGTLETESNST